MQNSTVTIGSKSVRAVY